MTRFPDAHEGELSVTRAQVVSEAGLSRGRAPARLRRSGSCSARARRSPAGASKPKILADAFEAIVAAVYLDGGFAGGVGPGRARCSPSGSTTVELKNFYDFKTRLQETAQARLKATPTYRVVQELGPDHDKRFVVAVTIGDDEWARAVGKSKKEAEQMAAAEAHFRLEGSDVGIRPKRR